MIANLLGAFFILIFGASPFTETSVPNNTPSPMDSKQNPLVLALKSEENHPPRITSMKIALVSPGDPRQGFKALVTSEDPDGDNVTVFYKWFLNGQELIGERDELLPWSDDFKKGDEITLEALPYDGQIEGLWRAKGSIRVPNSPPVITSPPRGRFEDGTFLYEAKAEDPDGDPIEFSIRNSPKGMTADPKSGIVEWRIPEGTGGEQRFTLVVRDNDGGEAVMEMKFTVPGRETGEQ
jgi:hypothetical protein